YDRVALSQLLAGDTTRDALRLRPHEWYADARVDLRFASVEQLDLEARRCRLDDGDGLGFDDVVVCTGSDPLLPPLEGIDLPGVVAFRDPRDCDEIGERARGAKKAVVIGGGLLGLEAARGIAALGCPVTVVHLVDRLMERQLDAGAADVLLGELPALGVEVQLECQTTAIAGGDVAGGRSLPDR